MAGGSRLALVLAGGAARGAYEVGVVAYLLRDVAREIGKDVPLDVLCGTSVGAINAAALAAFADQPRGRADQLEAHWKGLSVHKLVRTSASEIMSLVTSLVGKSPPPSANDVRRGGILDPAGIEELVRVAIPFARIREHLEANRLDALTLSTTHVASGRTVLFVDRAERVPMPTWSSDPTIVVRPATINAEHALASAAVPLLFPAVRIDGTFYCDGGLRHNVPLSPARRLGATSMIVVNPRFVSSVPLPEEVATAHETSYPGALFLLGKALNALLLDRIDNDIDRLRRINEILAAGEKRYGPDFSHEIGERARVLDVVQVRASEDIGQLASEYVRSSEFARRSSGVLGRVLRRLGEWEGASEADLLSYVLFDGGFAARLIDLGYRDARTQHAALVRVVSKALEGRS